MAKDVLTAGWKETITGARVEGGLRACKSCKHRVQRTFEAQLHRPPNFEADFPLLATLRSSHPRQYCIEQHLAVMSKPE